MITVGYLVTVVIYGKVSESVLMQGTKPEPKSSHDKTIQGEKNENHGLL
jgi:hypothetical protein